MSADTLRQQFVFVPRTALIASVILHLTLPFGWLTFKALEALGIQIFPRTSVQDVYQEYVQVDIVALPDIAIKDLEVLDATLPEVEKPASTPTPSQAPEEDLMEIQAKADAAKKAAEAAEAAEAKRKAKAKAEAEKKKALKQIEEDLKREQALKSLAKNEGKQGRQKLKGNITSKGTSAVGALGTPKDQYTSIVMAKIKEKFYIMPSQRDRGLTNTVHLELFPTGRVRSKRFVKRSADSLFDSAVMQAVDDAQPLPIPEDLSLIQGGITVTFRAEEAK